MEGGSQCTRWALNISISQQGGRGLIYNFFITRWATEAVWQWRRWQDVGVSETATETPEEQTVFFNPEKVKVTFFATSLNSHNCVLVAGS